MVDTTILREQLSKVRPSSAAVAAEGGGWSAYLAGVPVHGEGEDLDDALDDRIDALREYAGDWNYRLKDAANHRENWALVTLVD